MSYSVIKDKVLIEVEPRTAEVRDSGIYVPADGDASAVGRVLSRGREVYDDIQVGCKVLFQPYLVEAAWHDDVSTFLAVTADENIYGVIRD